MTPSSLEIVRPAFFWTPPAFNTLGDEVAEVAALAGFSPDPEQRLALDALFARTQDKRVTAFEFMVVCSRQNLKTGFLKQAALGWLYVTEEELTIWSAHEFGTAQEAFRDMCQLIESTPDLDREVKQIHRGNGDEAIELFGNRRLKFKARTKSGGRGLSGNKVVLDEAMYLQGVHMGTLVPTLSARVNPQLIMAGSAGLADSQVQRDIRDRGRAGGDPSLTYLEWGDPDQDGCEVPDCDHALDTDGCALDDRDRWRRANPQMGGRITEDYIAAERRAIPAAEFARERLGWWDKPASLAGVVIPAELWDACADLTSTVTDAVFAVDVAPDQSWAAIVAAGTSGTRTHVEITSRSGVMDHRQGMDWIVPRLVEIKAERVVMEKRSAAASLAPALEQAGIEVTYLTTEEVGQACAALFSQVVERALIHLGQPELDRAVANAARRDIGDGAWAWSRRKSSIDISPLYAATLAAWVHTTVGNFNPGIYFL